MKKYTPKKVIDIHCHILPGIDDGSSSWEESFEMLELAKREGIEIMVATPHFKYGRHNASPVKIDALIVELKERAEKRGLEIPEIIPGNEVFFFNGFTEEYDRRSFNTLCNTDYVLTEFMPNTSFAYIKNAAEEVTGLGLVPILAHVERYECLLADTSLVRLLADIGCKIQINASTIDGKLGGKARRFVIKLLKERLVDYIGTDAHDSKRRKPVITKCIRTLYKKYDEEYIDDILYNNAMEIIDEGVLNARSQQR